jgi:hypothetical protein
MVRGLAVAVVALLCACERDRQFHTVALYEAPRGHYFIRIEGKGVVRAGDDMSQQASGVLTVSPSSTPGPAGPPPVILEVTLRGSQVQFGNQWLADGSGPDRGALGVSRLLSDGGYSVHPDELDELVSATEGVLLGPKGTLMSGQTRVLKVVATTFNR